MKLKKATIYDKNKLKTYGHVDYGPTLKIEPSHLMATNALVFMLVSLDGKFKWPIAYFFTNSLNSTVQAELIRTALCICHENGIKVWSVTCDGPKVNVATLHRLGCSLFADCYDEIKNYFEHPISKERVYATMDACHMLKNARNSFQSIRDLKHNGNEIKWQYVVDLHNFQETINLKLANKISTKHVLFKNNIMKVRLAAQTLSSSVANALEYLFETGVEEFKDVSETINFIRTVDALFDFLNSRNIFQVGIKKPITPENIKEMDEQMQVKINYLFTLTADDQPMFKHSKRTFLLGFATSVKSIIEIAKQIFVQVPIYTHLNTYNFSQDFLELFFGCIRMRFGCNNNPTCVEFLYALRRILAKNYIQAGQYGNCLSFNENIGSVYSLKRKQMKITMIEDVNIEMEKMNNEKEEEAIIQKNVKNLLQNEDIKDNILNYIGGYIIRKIVPSIECNSCLDALADDVKKIGVNDERFEKFLTFKNTGGLIYPKDSVLKIIKKTEKLISILTDNFTNFHHINFHSIIIKNKIDFAQSNILKETDLCQYHPCDVPHKVQIIELITRKYLNTRLFTQTLKQSMDLAKEKLGKRQQQSKLILFNNL